MSGAVPAQPPTRYQSGGWVGMSGNDLWLLTNAAHDDPIIERSWDLVGEGAALHQLVAMYTDRSDLMYVLAGAAGELTQVVVRGPVRAEIATSAGTMVLTGSPDGGDWAGHVVPDPVLSVTLIGGDAAADPRVSVPPVRWMPEPPAAVPPPRVHVPLAQPEMPPVQVPPPAPVSAPPVPMPVSPAPVEDSPPVTVAEEQRQDQAAAQVFEPFRAAPLRAESVAAEPIASWEPSAPQTDAASETAPAAPQSEPVPQEPDPEPVAWEPAPATRESATRESATPEPSAAEAASPEPSAAAAAPTPDHELVPEPERDSTFASVAESLDVRWLTSPNPELVTSTWASEATSVVPLVQLEAGRVQPDTGEAAAAPALDTPSHDTPAHETPAHDTPSHDTAAPGWPPVDQAADPVPAPEPQRVPEPQEPHRHLSGLISDVSWADALADPSERAAGPAPRRALNDVSWTSEPVTRPEPPTPPVQPSLPVSAPPVSAPPVSAPPAAPVMHGTPVRYPAAVTPPPLATPLQSFPPSAPLQPPAQPQPVQFGDTTTRQDLDITIWRPIAETSVITGGGLTVAAVRCVDGHLNPLIASSCRVCAKSVPPQSSLIVPRPTLGVLRMSTSDTIRLDHGVIFGRDPGTPDANRRDQPYFVKLTDKDISRRHLEVVLDGWDVVAIDLNSSNGSAITMPGGMPEVIPGGDRRLLLPGTIVHLSDTISFVFEVTE